MAARGLMKILRLSSARSFYYMRVNWYPLRIKITWICFWDLYFVIQSPDGLENLFCIAAARWLTIFVVRVDWYPLRIKTTLKFKILEIYRYLQSCRPQNFCASNEKRSKSKQITFDCYNINKSKDNLLIRNTSVIQ